MSDGNAPGRARGPGRFRFSRGWRARTARISGAAAALALAAGALMGTGTTPADAVPRGEQVTFDGGLTISNFVLANGIRAYCIEVSQSEPSGVVRPVGRVSSLPGIAGKFPSWEDSHGMRQMNYLIDRHGQARNAWKAAAVQLTIWRMRENFRPGNAALDRKIDVLLRSDRGRALVQASDGLYADAKANARPPVAPKPNTGKLAIEPAPNGATGSFRVAYPKGTTSLSVEGGVFARNQAASITVSPDSASARFVTAAAGATEITVSGSWVAQGDRGWDATLDVYDTSTSSGAAGQRIAVASGNSVLPELTGRFAAVTRELPPPPAPPRAWSRAQAAATAGGTMTDTLLVEQAAGTTVEMWPDAGVDFTAYLEPVAGAPKFTESWEPKLGEPYQAQAEDPKTGAPIWDEWWTDASGTPLRDASGARIATTDAHGASTTGVAADGTAYPVLQLGQDGTPIRDSSGQPTYFSGREAVLEERRDPQTWTAAEIDAMSSEQRCIAQPVYRSPRIAVAGTGEYSSPEVTVRSGGTIHWVERVTSGSDVVHEGQCGLANETTRIDQPAVTTRAVPQVALGDELFDIATVSGKLAPGATYAVRFEAYRAPDTGEGFDDDTGAMDGASATPTCSADNILFRSDLVPVSGVGEVRSPGFIARPEHGSRVWWVETLYLNGDDGPRVLHRGACGLDTETTIIGRPAVETRAMDSAPAGEAISDTAVVSGAIAENAGARWEVSFAGYRAVGRSQGASDAPSEAELRAVPVCAASNRLFETEPVAVTGPGEVASPVVIAEADWVGAVWWVETLWLIQGDQRTAMHVGECGIDTETTVITIPEVTTDASAFAALGDRISDTATVSGALSQRPGAEHRIVFRGYRGDPSRTGTAEATCTEENLLFTTEAVLVTGEGAVRSPEVTALPEYGSTIWWVETLTQHDGETERELHRGACGLPGETTTVQFPSVRTESAGAIEVGRPMFDTVIVSGAVSERTDVEFRVRFRAYAQRGIANLVCSPEHEIAALSDPEGVRVTGPGAYRSRAVTALPEHTGGGGFVETLVMIENGTEHVVAVGDCGAPSERFEIRPRDVPPLAATGLNAFPLWWIGGASALLGTGALFFALRRRRASGAVRECRDLVSAD